MTLYACGDLSRISLPGHRPTGLAWSWSSTLFRMMLSCSSRTDGEAGTIPARSGSSRRRRGGQIRAERIRREIFHMQDQITIDSPCIGACFYNHDGGFCTGCGRTLEDIGGWSRLDENKKKEIIKKSKKRLIILPPKTSN